MLNLLQVPDFCGFKTPPLSVLLPFGAGRIFGSRLYSRQVKLALAGEKINARKVKRMSPCKMLN
jgi:hypothetical protein